MKKNTGIALFINNFLGVNLPVLFEIMEEISAFEIVKKKRHLFFEGDKGENFYFLISGKIKLFKISPVGKDVVVKIVTPGEIFAEIIIIEDQYPVNALALEESNLLKINGKKFLKFITSNSELNKKFMFILLQRIKTLLSRLEIVGTENVEERLIHYLSDLAVKHGDEFELPISKGELASLLFTSPETISRTFARLKEKCLIDVCGKKIIVKNLTDS